MLQSQALNILKLGKNVFLTGAAGAGKTWLLNNYIDHLLKYNVRVAITASTGIAATHLGGQTIHSWSGIGIKDSLTPEDLEKIADNKRIRSNYRNTKVLIIDEISMLHANQLDMVDQIAQRILETNEPFGGLQVILCGDFFQLPPIARNNQKTHFAFNSAVWQSADFNVCYLTEQHRQGQDPLLDVLNNIRNCTAGENVKAPLRTRYKKEPLSPSGDILKPTILYARNINVDAINERELNKLSGEVKSYAMSAKGFSKHTDSLKKSCLAPEFLNLKVGAQVMFVKNSPEGIYVNGTRGVVISFNRQSSCPIVQLPEGYKLEIDYVDWQYLENDIVRASITQLPIRLAWAITIHKSQGMTLDALEVDLSDAFEPGMGYVALSRVKTLNGLKLLGLNEMALTVNAEVLLQDKNFHANSANSLTLLNQLSAEELEANQQETLKIRFWGSLNYTEKPKRQKKAKVAKPAKVPTHEITALLISEKLTVAEVAAKRSLTNGTIITHLEKLKGQNNLPDIQHLRQSIPENDLNEIINEFKNSEDGRLSPIYEKFNGRHGYDTLQLVRLLM